MAVPDIESRARSTRSHRRAREIVGQSGRWQSEYHDAMIEHDANVGTGRQVFAAPKSGARMRPTFGADHAGTLHDELSFDPSLVKALTVSWRL
jgi:hypothetical protein